MKVGKMMSANVVHVGLDDPLHKVKAIFERTKFHHLLVIQSGKLWGVVSDRDLLKSVSPNIGTITETLRDVASLNKKVHQIMTRKPITLSPDADVYEAIRVFNEHNVSCIPILNNDNSVAGILSWRDVFKALEAYQLKKRQNKE
ncbi:CBS domain-containing protein [Thalassolituus sp.]|jgi:acetoin utilization protein AcuB|uniref:CBS domain-containing protein n=1 Tax=Thalassolituus sp. TaxID=2030822 RepID=UPI002A834EE4|nr:CBS domain-containing protein [Thalassolituus sp.]